MSRFVILILFFGLSCGMLLGIIVMETYPTEYRKELREVRELITQCEAYIPRNQNCKLVAVIDERENK